MRLPFLLSVAWLATVVGASAPGTSAVLPPRPYPIPPAMSRVSPPDTFPGAGPLLRVETVASEWGAGQWVEAPRVYVRATGELLVDLDGTPWSVAEISEKVDDHLPTLKLHRFPDASRVVHLGLNAPARTATVAGTPPFPVAEVPEVLASLGATYDLAGVYAELAERIRRLPDTQLGRSARHEMALELEIAKAQLDAGTTPRPQAAALLAPGAPLRRLAATGDGETDFAALATRAADASRRAALIERLRPPRRAEEELPTQREVEKRIRAENRRYRLRWIIGVAVAAAGLVALGYYTAWYVPVAVVVLAGIGIYYALDNMRIM